MAGGRPVEAIGMWARAYSVPVWVIRRIGVESFASMDHDARQTSCLNQHRRVTGKPVEPPCRRLMASEIAALLHRVTGDSVRVGMSNNGKKRIVERWTGSRWVKFMSRAR